MPFSSQEDDEILHDRLMLKGSKSIINRLLCMSLYHDVDIKIDNVNLCNDVKEMLTILDLLGKKYNLKCDEIPPPHLWGWQGGEDTLTIPHSDTKLSNLPFQKNDLSTSPLTIYINEAGTCLRFVLPFLAFSEYESVTIILGDQLSKRPILPLINCLNQAGANISIEKNIIYIKKYRHINSIFYLNSSDSSQFLSSLMMFASSRKLVSKIVLSINDDYDKIDELQGIKNDDNFNTDNCVKNTFLPSQSYIKMTEDILKLFNTYISYSKNEICVTPNSPPLKINISSDPDYSTACYFWLYSFLMKKPLFIQKSKNIYQPDYYFIEIIKRLNISFINKKDFIAIDINKIDSFPNALLFDMTNMPDQIITLAFLLLIIGVKAKIHGCQTLAKKESNRLEGIIENIKILGGEAFYENELLHIIPAGSLFDNGKRDNYLLKTYNDHRFAMTFLVLRQKYPFINIDNIDCIAKSYKDFLVMISR
ncbi:MAG: hypothetical protein FWG98_03810 [Candidatus Cloacimonetes bacterium]|nr:hypothetical protein [Candidatus Cloacimonadota bacterium]